MQALTKLTLNALQPSHAPMLLQGLTGARETLHDLRLCAWDGEPRFVATRDMRISLVRFPATTYGPMLMASALLCVELRVA